jgi:hypothetical protein
LEQAAVSFIPQPVADPNPPLSCQSEMRHAPAAAHGGSQPATLHDNDDRPRHSVIRIIELARIPVGGCAR